jgi:hypothetical protein
VFWKLITFGLDYGNVNKLLPLRNAVCQIDWNLKYSVRLKTIAANAEILDLINVMKYLPHRQAKTFLLDCAQK